MEEPLVQSRQDLKDQLEEMEHAKMTCYEATILSTGG
jgi:hypothetical protein